MTAVRRPSRRTLTRFLAVGIAGAVWIISWIVAMFTAMAALVIGAFYWETESLRAVVFALISFVVTFGGPIAGIKLGQLVWRSN